MKERLIPAADVIHRISRDLEYSRSHVASVLRRHAEQLKAKKEGRHWLLPAGASRLLKRLVRDVSGRRYKLGETGPHA